ELTLGIPTPPIYPARIVELDIQRNRNVIAQVLGRAAVGRVREQIVHVRAEVAGAALVRVIGRHGQVQPGDWLSEERPLQGVVVHVLCTGEVLERFLVYLGLIDAGRRAGDAQGNGVTKGD